MDLFVSYQAMTGPPDHARCTGSDVIRGRGAPKTRTDVLDVVEAIRTITGHKAVVITFWAELPGLGHTYNDQS